MPTSARLESFQRITVLEREIGIVDQNIEDVPEIVLECTDNLQRESENILMSRG